MNPTTIDHHSPKQSRCTAQVTDIANGNHAISTIFGYHGHISTRFHLQTCEPLSSTSARLEEMRREVETQSRVSDHRKSESSTDEHNRRKCSMNDPASDRSNGVDRPHFENSKHHQTMKKPT